MTESQLEAFGLQLGLAPLQPVPCRVLKCLLNLALDLREDQESLLEVLLIGVVQANIVGDAGLVCLVEEFLLSDPERVLGVLLKEGQLLLALEGLLKEADDVLRPQFRLEFASREEGFDAQLTLNLLGLEEVPLHTTLHFHLLNIAQQCIVELS